MAGVRDIKRRIRSVSNTQQITKAMKMVAAAKLRKTQEAVVASRPYARKLEEVLGRIVASSEENAHPLMVKRPVKSVCVILMTADRGLAGGFNANLIRKAISESARFEGVEIKYMAMGRRGRDFLKRRKKDIYAEYIGINDTPTIAEAQDIAKAAVDGFMNEDFDEVYVIYQEFITPVQQRPVIKKILPIPYEEKEEEDNVGYLYEPNPKKVLATLLPKFILNEVFQAIMESKASEHGARMTAMSSATDNAVEMIDKLTLSFNRARQAAITSEISEIVGGANALNA